MPKKSVLVDLEVSQHKALKKLSSETGASVNWLIRKAIDTYLAAKLRRTK